MRLGLRSRPAALHSARGFGDNGHSLGPERCRASRRASQQRKSMSTEARAPLSHDELEEALSTLEDPPEAAEVHGHLLGCLAAGGVAPAEWQARLVAELALEGGTELVARALEQLHQQAVALLAEQDFGLELLLPGQDPPLADRVEDRKSGGEGKRGVRGGG